LQKLRTIQPKTLSETNGIAGFDGSEVSHEMDIDSIRARGYVSYFILAVILAVFLIFINFSTFHLNFKDKFFKSFFSFMKYRYKYYPLRNLDQIIFDVIKNKIPSGLLLDSLGKKLKHTIPNCELHRIKTLANVIDFYRLPVKNLTEYDSMVRGENGDLPKNLYMLENPVRFHPEDKESYHGGITAYPGVGGAVFGIRNQRIYRQFQPKKDWFDYEDQTFNFKRPDANMPWNTEIAEKMDRYPNLKYNLKLKGFRRLGPPK
uniref:Large ribosomal subunit protein mL50 n=1 Tax=Dracunculus medinensis TaxID=318479 RepID=A0A0N4UQH7_DRAME